MKFKYLTAVVASVSIIAFGPAFASDDGGYYAPTGSAQEDRGMMGRFNDWLSGFGTLGEGLASAFANPYVVARGGFSFYNDNEYEGGSVQSGYNPRPTDVFDISRITTNNTGAADADMGGNFTLGFGIDYAVDTDYGGIRTEFEFGYNEFSSDYCFTGLPAVNPNRPGSRLGRRLVGELDDDGNFVSEGPTGPQYPLVGGPPDATTAGKLDNTSYTKADAQRDFEDRLGKVCATYDEPTYHFVVHNYWDLKLGGIAALTDMDLGLFNELAINLGVGVGYMLVDSQTSRPVLLDDAHEPRLAAADIRFEETVPAGKVFDDTKVLRRFVFDDDPKALVQSTPRNSDGGRNRDPNRPNKNLEADDDLESTRGATPKIDGGLYVPLSVGVSYDFAKMLNVPVTAEVIYRYNVVAPDIMSKAHGFLLGVRYAF